MIIGLTGGIGAGKSTVSKVIDTLGYKIYDCDSRAKELMVTDKSLINKIKQLFGEKSYINKELNRTYISECVFNDKSMLEKLNSLVHPAVRCDILRWEEENSTERLLFIESAILIESNIKEIIDYSINVYAPEDLRIKRVCKRDKTDINTVKNRILNQTSDKIREESCDFTIICDDKTSIIQQIIKLINILLNK